LTRSYKRPTDLERCIESVQCQTNPNFEQIIIRDDGGHGLHWANKQIFEQSWKCHGQYVYILDDDDFLLCDNFIAELDTILNNLETPPDIIFCKGWITNNLFPKEWKKYPDRGAVGSPNFIVKREIFLEHAPKWDESRAADYQFLKSILNTDPTIFWWNKIVFYAGMSAGFTQTEKEQMGIIR